MNSYLLVLAALVAAAVGMPRYVLVPVEELPRLRAGRALPAGRPQDGQYAAPSDTRPVRQAGAGGYGEQVDYGAYTGGYGAFGWYTDHPVYSYGH